MSEYLTTGQMIDKLQIGQIAETVARVKDEYVIRTNEGYYWCDSKGNPFTYDHLIINNVVLGIFWKLQPNYVSFIDAIQAFKGKGKSIANYVGGRVYKYYWDEGEPKCKERGYDCEISMLLPFVETFEGKWTIED